MPRPWMKMWLEALEDLKLISLSLAERGAWWGLLKLAAKCEAKGRIMSASSGLSIDEIADALHIKSNEDRLALESMIVKMEKRGSLKWNDNILLVVHFEERQRVPPSAQPGAVAERVRLYRERQDKKPGKRIHKKCPVCNFKAMTDEVYCPECSKRGKTSILEKDYTAGPYSHMVNR